MTTALTFDEYDNMVVTDKNGEVSTFYFVHNMDVLEDALEQVAPKNLESIRDAYEDELDKAQDKEAENDANHGYKQSVKELLQKNWDAVYAIVADDLI